ncbi:hypothetical protein HK104_009906 [Borealophlyctis nickersoniae]|nr:hypothetical protein HK104_009906 [Borealophlyctis nickersoniae]
MLLTSARAALARGPARKLMRPAIGIRFHSQEAHAPAPVGTYALFDNYVAKLQPHVKEITAKELNDKFNEGPEGPPETYHVVDVRETDEFNQGHLPFAIYLGRGNLERDIEALIPDTYDDVILYCAGGKRSIVAADSLQRMGYKNVRSLKGGFVGWKEEGYKILKHSSPVYTARMDYKTVPGLYEHEK